MNQLLPPLQIFLLELLACASLLIFANSKSYDRTIKQTLLFSLTASLLLTAVVIFYWFIGAAWNLPSTIGKLISAFISLAIPIFLTAVTFQVCQRFEIKKTTANITSLIVGLIGVIPMIAIGVLLACVTTGDCL